MQSQMAERSDRSSGRCDRVFRAALGCGNRVGQLNKAPLGLLRFPFATHVAEALRDQFRSFRCATRARVSMRFFLAMHFLQADAIMSESGETQPLRHAALNVRFQQDRTFAPTALMGRF